MSGLSKVDRQRAKIKALRAHLETWQTWARALLDAPADASGPAMRQQIATVWEATRARVDAEMETLGGFPVDVTTRVRLPGMVGNEDE